MIESSLYQQRATDAETLADAAMHFRSCSKEGYIRSAPIMQRMSDGKNDNAVRDFLKGPWAEVRHWVPQMMALLDKRYLVSPTEQKLGDYCSHLTMKPSDYFRRNVRIGSMVTKEEADDREKIGVKNLMWGSDYPHPEGSWPTTAAKMDASLKGVPEDDLAAILGGNALEWYGFDEKKLAPIVDRIGPTADRFEA